MGSHALGVARRAEAEPGRQVERHRHAGAHCLAVQQVGAKAGFGLQRMPERMAEIQERTQIGGLAFVGGHNARLGEAALLDCVGPGGGIAREDAGAVLLAPGEEGGVVDQAVLHHLGIARQQFARGQGIEYGGIRQHQPRLIEGADEVLAMAGIDAGLAAD